MHYYKINGDSCHEVVGKNGVTRPTRITDARTMNLFPSVTTIMDLQAKPALIQWLQNQVLEAAMASPFKEGDNPEVWKKIIVQQSRSIGEKAAKRGNEIHDAMESYFKGGEILVTDIPYTCLAVQMIHERFPNYFWVAEASFAHKAGFGGRVDLYGHSPEGDAVIIDFKTKDKTNVKDMVQWDDHCIQLAAYQIGLQLPTNTRRFNLFISTNSTTPGLCVLRECKKFDKYADIFLALLNLWQKKNQYIPKWETE